MGLITKIKIALVISLLVLSCGGRDRGGNEKITDQFWQVKKVEGNKLILPRGKTVTLLGVKNDEIVESFLKSIIKTKIKFHFDESKTPRRIKGTRDFYGYVKDEHGADINALILKNKVSALNSDFLKDSLYSYREYASKKYAGAFDIEKIQSATFMVETFKNGIKKSYGSGFFISEDGIGLSNHHVFEGGNSWKIKLCLDGSEHQVSKVYASDEELDYVIFQVKSEEDFSFLKLSQKEAKQGDQIFAYGNPRELTCTLSKGIVSAIRGDDGEFVQIDAAISPGSSGGPVVNSSGEAIGIATMKRLKCENCNFAMSVKVVEDDIPD